MILDLRSFFLNEKADVTFEYLLDLTSFELSAGEFPFKEPVKVYGNVSQNTGMSILNATAEFVFLTKCDRCLKEINEQNKVTFTNILVKSLPEEDDNDEIILVEDEKLNVDELVISNIILSLPMKHLCDENCKGLCPVCGKSLEFGDCSCNKKSIDPRLESLKSFFE